MHSIKQPLASIGIGVGVTASLVLLAIFWQLRLASRATPTPFVRTADNGSQPVSAASAPRSLPDATPTPPEASPTPAAQATAVVLPTGLSVEEHALKAIPQLDSLYFEPVEGTMADVLKKHRYALSVGPVESDANAKLQPFGYRIVPNATTLGYTLYRDEKPILHDIDGFWPVSVNEAGDDFAMVVYSSGTPWLVRRDLLTRKDQGGASNGFFAAFLGNNLLTASQVDTDSYPVQVELAGRVIFSDTSIPAGYKSVEAPLKGMWSSQGHWWIEVGGEIFQDGESLNKRHGYAETFDFELLGGHPFYFYSDEKTMGAIYDNQEIPLGYSEVPHYGCCSNGELNPHVGQNMVAFFARRQQTWYYVQLGIFANATPVPTATWVYVFGDNTVSVSGYP
jgi:hypothetical protein